MIIGLSAFLVLLVAIFYFAAYLGPNFKINAGPDPKGWRNKIKDVMRLLIVFTCALIVMVIVLKMKVGVYAYKFAFFCYIAYAVYRIITSIGKNDSAPKRITASVCAFLVGSGWIVYPHRITIDLAALAVTIWLIGMLGNLSFVKISIFSTAIVLYDAIHVFGTHLMQKAAGGIVQSGIPAMIDLVYFQMGVGDIVLPGMAVVFGIRLAKELKVPILGAAGILGYVIGLFVTLAVLFVSQYPQPATIYLIPSVFVFLLAAAWAKGVFSKFVHS